MSKVIRYVPLDGMGRVRLDLDACPRQFGLIYFLSRHEDEPEPEPENAVSMSLHLTPEGRWIEEIEKFDPSGDKPSVVHFREVSPAYVIQELRLGIKELPPDLAMLEPYREAMRANPGIRTYGPRSKIEPIPPVDRFELAAALPSKNRAHTQGVGSAPANGRAFEALAELPKLITLDSAAALVHRSSRTLERYKGRGLPRPFVLGGGGKPNEYREDEMRRFLQKTFNRPIPEVDIGRCRHPKNG